MTDLFLVADRILILTLLIAAGYASLRTGILTHRSLKSLSSLLINVTLPALILVSLQVPVSGALISGAGEIVALSAVYYALSLAIAAAVLHALGTRAGERGVFAFALVFPNVGFMGFPVIETLYGTGALFYAVICNLIFNVLVFSVGIMMMTGGGEGRGGFEPRMLLNAGIAASLLGLALFLLSVRIPSPLFEALDLLGGTTTPLAMVVVGALLATFPARRMVEDWRIGIAAAARLLVIPVAAWLVLQPFGTDPLAFAVLITLAAMPTAANTVIFAEEYDADALLASRIVFVTTMSSVVTIPLLTGLLF
ncbi:MAG TPA: AEC family transporter [Methanoculleus sp.]|nr:AEC family transporter [Methanoculleus sp.]